MSSSSTASKFHSEGDDDLEHNAQVKPERNLLSAVLARAILDAFGTAHCERHIVRGARQWLFGKLKPSVPFSFAWVALHLDIDPKALQRSLRTYEDSPEDMQDRLTLLR